MQVNTVEKLRAVGCPARLAGVAGGFVCNLYAAGLCDRHRAGR